MTFCLEYESVYGVRDRDLLDFYSRPKSDLILPREILLEITKSRGITFVHNFHHHPLNQRESNPELTIVHFEINLGLT